ncbi:MAG: BON domain-containing protein [Candidatus Binatia bacterium]
MNMSSTLKPILVSLVLTLILSVSGCTALTGQSAGEYVDDSTITASVKAKLVADQAANLTRVDVDTTNRVVSLNGVVESPDHKRRAAELATQVAGVRRVDNNLQVQGRN